MDLEGGTILDMMYMVETDEIMFKVQVPYDTWFGVTLGQAAMANTDIVWFETATGGTPDDNTVTDGFGSDYAYGNTYPEFDEQNWTGTNTYNFDEQTEQDTVEFTVSRPRSTTDPTGIDFEFPLDEEFEMGYAYGLRSGILSYHDNTDKFSVTIPSDGSSAFGVVVESFASVNQTIAVLAAGSVLMQLF